MEFTTKQKVLFGSIAAVVAIVVVASVWSFAAAQDGGGLLSRKKSTDKILSEGRASKQSAKERDTTAGSEDSSKTPQTEETMEHKGAQQNGSVDQASRTKSQNKRDDATQSNKNTHASRGEKTCSDDTKAMYANSRDVNISIEESSWDREKSDLEGEELAKKRTEHKVRIAEIEGSYQESLRQIDCAQD